MSTRSIGCILSPDPWIELCWRSTGQPKLFCPTKQVLDGGGVPPCSTARRALAHGLKLGGDLLQGAVWRCRLDAGDQPHQPVIALLAWRAVQQCRLDDAFGHQPPHSASQPFHRPGGLGSAVQDAHDIAPRLGGPHSPDGRQPKVQVGQHTIQVCGVAASTDLADGVRITGAQARVAADTAAAARSPEAGLRALGDQSPLQLGDGA